MTTERVAPDDPARPADAARAPAGARTPASLQRRLVLGVVAAVGALWLATALLTWWDARHEIDELLDAHLAQSAALLVAQQAHGSDDDDLMDAPALHRYARRVTFQVWHQGDLVLRSPNAPLRPLSHSLQGFETLTIDGEAWRIFSARGMESDVQVYVGEQLDSREDILWAGLRGLLGPLVVALPLIGLAVWAAVRAGLAPLRSLGQVLRERPSQAMDPVALPGGTPPDMAPLLDALNALLQRIAGLIENERRFTADAAHELRTPIAAIRTQAQVALGASDDGERRHALQSTLLGCDRATHLVQQLLTLSRLESSAAAGAGAVDLSTLAQRVLAEQALTAIDRGQQLSLQAEPGLAVTGDGTLLAVLLRNLLDNALRYSPDGAEVAVQVQADARSGAVGLVVEDSGPGLPPADLARLGERFFRGLGTAGAAQGSGLGWSIVRRIAQVHGATVAAERSTRLGGLAVTVRWPGRRTNA